MAAEVPGMAGRLLQGTYKRIGHEAFSKYEIRGTFWVSLDFTGSVTIQFNII